MKISLKTLGNKNWNVQNTVNNVRILENTILASMMLYSYHYYQETIPLSFN